MHRIGNSLLANVAGSIALLIVTACAPMEEQKERQKFYQKHVVHPSDASARKARQPFGCDARDLANFTCE